MWKPDASEAQPPAKLPNGCGAAPATLAEKPGAAAAFADGETTASSSELLSDDINLKHKIIAYHEAAGVKTFSSAWEAACFLLLADDLDLPAFIELVEAETAHIRSNVGSLRDSDFWKYKLLKPSNSLAAAAGGARLGKSAARIGSERGVRAKRSKSTVKLSMDQSLAQTMHIPLDHAGELVAFSEIEQWTSPAPADLERLRDKIISLWMEPLQLRQQDIVRATGVGAPYICYLFKDPDNPNMTQRRRIEAYSVLSHLMRMYEEGAVTDADFIHLRNNRIQSRYIKRQFALGSRAERDGARSG